MDKKLKLKQIPYISGSEYTKEESLVSRKAYNDGVTKIFAFAKAEDGSYYILISPEGGGNIAIKCANTSEASDIIDQLLLNYYIVTRENSEETFISLSEDRATLEMPPIQGFSAKKDYTASAKAKKILDQIREQFGLEPMSDNEYKKFYTAYDAKKRIMDFTVGPLFEDFSELNEYEKKNAIFSQEMRMREAKLNSKYNTFLEKMNTLTQLEINQIIEMFQKLYETKLQEGRTDFAISSIDEVTIGYKPLEQADDIAQRIVEDINIGTDGEKAYDFEKSNLTSPLQDYILRYLYGKDFRLTERERNIIEQFKVGDFSSVNWLLRGSLRRNERFTGEMLRSLVDEILGLDIIQKRLPVRDFDITIRRIGLGIDKDIGIGTRNKYESFVSFGTNSGTIVKDVSGKITNHYTRVLKKDEPAIPVEILNPGLIQGDRSECEILCMPFSYEVMDEYMKSKYANKRYITMGNIENIPLLELLKDRLLTIKTREKGIQAGIDLTILGSEEEYERMLELGFVEDAVKTKQIDFFETMEEFSGSEEFESIYELDRKIARESYRKSNSEAYNYSRNTVLFARMLANLDGLSKEDKDLLLFCAMYYDCAKDDNIENPENVGAASYDRIRSFSVDRDLSDEEKEIVKYVITQSSRDDGTNDESNLRGNIILSYLKDSIELGKVHLGKYEGLKSQNLRRSTSLRLVKFAYQVELYYRDYMENVREERIIKAIEESLEKVEKAIRGELVFDEPQDEPNAISNEARDVFENAEKATAEDVLSKTVEETTASLNIETIDSLAQKVMRDFEENESAKNVIETGEPEQETELEDR